MAIIRDGKVVRVAGPGIVLHVPLLERPVRVDLRPFTLDMPPEWLGATARRIDPPTVRFGLRISDAAAAILGAGSLIEDVWEALRVALEEQIPGSSSLGEQELARRLEAARMFATRRTQRFGIEVFSVEIVESLESEAKIGSADPAARDLQ
jgi:hypothetical protein